MVIVVRVSDHPATRPPCHQEVDSPPTLFTDLSVLTRIPSFKAAITLCKCVNYLRVFCRRRVYFLVAISLEVRWSSCEVTGFRCERNVKAFSPLSLLVFRGGAFS